MRLEIVEMRHKGHGGVYRAPAKSVAFWQQRGWEVMDKTQAPAGASAPTTPPAVEAADTAPAARRSTKKEA